MSSEEEEEKALEEEAKPCQEAGAVDLFSVTFEDAGPLGIKFVVGAANALVPGPVVKAVNTLGGAPTLARQWPPPSCQIAKTHAQVLHTYTRHTLGYSI